MAALMGFGLDAVSNANKKKTSTNSFAAAVASNYAANKKNSANTNNNSATATKATEIDTPILNSTKTVKSTPTVTKATEISTPLLNSTNTSSTKSTNTSSVNSTDTPIWDSTNSPFLEDAVTRANRKKSEAQERLNSLSNGKEYYDVQPKETNAAKGTSPINNAIYEKADSRESNISKGKYADILKADDYAELSKAGDSKINWSFKSDAKYDYINDINNYRATEDSHHAMNGNNYAKYSFMTKDEIGVYNYLYAKEGKKAANKYLSELEPELDKQWYSGTNAVTTEAFDTNATTRRIGDVLTVAAQPVRTISSAVSLGDDVVRALQGKEVNPYSKWRQTSNMTNAIRSNNSETMEENYGKLASGAYNIVMSAADSAANAVFAGGLAQGTGATGKALMDATNKIGAALMSSEVASQAIAEEKEEGASNAQAMAFGTVRGVIEYASEKIGGEWVIKNIKANPLNFVKSTLLNMIPEGTEEVMSDAANGVFNIAADAILGTEESGIPKMLEYYKTSGTEWQKENPEMATVLAILGQEGLSFLGGALASFGSSAVQSYNNRISISQAAQRLNTTNAEIVSLMREMNTDDASAVYAAAELTDAQNAEELRERISGTQNAQSVQSERQENAQSVQAQENVQPVQAQENAVQQAIPQNNVQQTNVQAQNVNQTATNQTAQDVAPQTVQQNDAQTNIQQNEEISPAARAMAQAAQSQLNVNPTAQVTDQVTDQVTNPVNDQVINQVGNQNQIIDRTNAMAMSSGTSERTIPLAQETQIPNGFTPYGTRTAQTPQTVREASITPESTKQTIDSRTAQGQYNYMPVSNDEATQRADAAIREKGFTLAYAEWTNAVREGKNSAEQTATGILLYNNAVQAGDEKLAINILDTLVLYNHNTAQALQANRILRNLTPAGQLYAMEQTVQKLNENLEWNAPKGKKAEKVNVERKTRAAETVKAGKSAKATAVNRTIEKITTDSKYEDMIFTFEYGREAASNLEQYVRNEARSQMTPSTNTPTAMESLVGSLKRFARQKFLGRTGTAQPTNIEILTEYVENEAFFNEAWRAAQQAFNNQNDTATREYAGKFTKERIFADPATNKILQRAVYESAIESDETTAFIRKQAQLMPSSRISDYIAENLINQTGASGKTAGDIRKATEGYVNRVLMGNKTTTASIVKEGMRDMKVTFRQLASQSAATKDGVRSELADRISTKFGLSPESALEIADTVSQEYDAQLHTAMEAEIKKRFSDKEIKKNAKSIEDRFVEAINLGTFESDYSAAAMEKLFGYRVAIDSELTNKFLNAKTENERAEVIKEIQANIAKQIPSTLLDKWTALRYMNMLGNLRTQLRNILGNTAMGTTAAVKNSVRYLAETSAKAVDNSYQMTTSWHVSQDSLQAAKADYENNADFVNGDAKYNEGFTGDRFRDGIQDQRQIFGFKPLETYRKATNYATEHGDTIFIRAHYARALAGYTEAHGMDGKTLSGIVNKTITPTAEQSAMLDEARTYAAREAQEATFHDRNTLSDFAASFLREEKTPRAIKVFAEGVVPFRKTPANVLMRAYEYSPLGWVDTTIKAIKAQNGTVSGSDVINSFSKSLTGTGLFILGMILRNAGALRGEDDDEKQQAFDELRGEQDYSLTIGDTSVTIDWMAPAAIPMFMGAQLYDAAADGGIEIGDISDALMSVTDPLINMSMLQGVNDLLDNIKYSDNNIVQIALSSATSYLTQGLTNTMLGQIERTAEDKRYSTFTNSDSATGKLIQRVIGKASAKTPGWDYNQVEYVDAWGRTEDSGNVLARAFENFLSPGYISKTDTSEVEDELQRLYTAGQTNVFPSRISMTEKVNTYDENGTKTGDRSLSGDEYVQYQKVMGSTALEMVTELMNSSVYESLSDDAKAAAISDIYSYAKEQGIMSVENSAKKALKKDDGTLSNLPAYYAVKAAYSDATQDSSNRNYEELEGIVDSFSSLPQDVREKIADSTPELAKIAEANENGISAKEYFAVTDTVDAIEPAEGYTNTATWQKVTNVCSQSLSDDEKDYFAGVYLSDSAYAKYQTAREKGYTPYSVAIAYQNWQTAKGVDANGDGKTDTGSKKAAYIASMEAIGANEASATYFYNLFK